MGAALPPAALLREHALAALRVAREEDAAASAERKATHRALELGRLPGVIATRLGVSCVPAAEWNETAERAEVRIGDLVFTSTGFSGLVVVATCACGGEVVRHAYGLVELGRAIEGESDKLDAIRGGFGGFRRHVCPPAPDAPAPVERATPTAGESLLAALDAYIAAQREGY